MQKEHPFVKISDKSEFWTSGFQAFAVPNIPRHDDIWKSNLFDLGKRFEEELIFASQMRRVTDEQLENNGQTSAIETGCGQTGSRSVGVGGDDERIVLGGGAFDDPLVKLVEVLVVAGEEFRLKVDALSDSKK